MDSIDVHPQYITDFDPNRSEFANHSWNPGRFGSSWQTPKSATRFSWHVIECDCTWGWVKTLVPSEPQNSW